MRLPGTSKIACHRFAAALLMALSAVAQTDRGTVTGTVTDPAGAVIANAPLELRGTETGTVYPTVTSATGNYTFTQIPLGVYQLSVSVPGFKNFTRQNIRVQASQTLGVDIKLEVGSSSESVTVSADVGLLKTESSDVSTNVDGALLTSLPILPIGAGFSSSHGVRNPPAVANLTPGTYFDPGNNLRVNGSPATPWRFAWKARMRPPIFRVVARWGNPEAAQRSNREYNLVWTRCRNCPFKPAIMRQSSDRQARACSITP
jgi:hypothetical protein